MHGWEITEGWRESSVGGEFSQGLENQHHMTRLTRIHMPPDCVSKLLNPVPQGRSLAVRLEEGRSGERPLHISGNAVGSLNNPSASSHFSAVSEPQNELRDDERGNEAHHGAGRTL